MSYKAEVDTGEKVWSSNALRFATSAEAEAYGKDLYSRWTLVRQTRVAKSVDPVTAAWVDGKLKHVEVPS